MDSELLDEIVMTAVVTTGVELAVLEVLAALNKAARASDSSAVERISQRTKASVKL